jgi:hypothetical protein
VVSILHSHYPEVLRSHTLVLAWQVLGLFSDSEYGYHSYNRSQKDALFLNFILIYKSTFLIVVFPCMLTIIQLLFQQNALFFIVKSTRNYNLYFFVLYFCSYMFQPSWVIFRGLNANAWLKLLLITIY